MHISVSTICCWCCYCAFNSSRLKFMAYFSVHSKDNSFHYSNSLLFSMFCSRFYLSCNAMLGYLFECQCNSFLSVIHPLPLNTTVMAIFEIHSISFTFFVRFISWSQYSQKEYLDKSRSNAIDKANFIWHVFYNNAGSSFNDSSFIA